VSELTYLGAIREALIEEMERDPRVFLIGEDIGHFGGAFKVTEGLLERFGAAIQVLGGPAGSLNLAMGSPRAHADRA
jgi:pyruvate/2-oxoglutarate/acetoin dehydrogenase E1 component